ncbi:MAG TPA: ATP-binding protein [Ilumatobacteraceae bacterium]|nr:ATP-binding protein [Ilumatobacteraceae bacterium]HUC33652.1 ATP-binding protein [Ilumatobacteraceae bacterium]
MDPRTNPYSPGAGVRPVELAGRAEERQAFDVLMARAEAGRPAQSLVFFGVRGVGKTVLINELRATARDRGWITAKVEADQGTDRTPFRSQVSSALTTSLRHVQGRGRVGDRVKTALRTFKSFSLVASPDGSLSVGIDVEAARGRADTGSIAVDLAELAVDLADAARDLGSGAVLFIDELQHLDTDELAAVCHACHEAGQRDAPFFVVGAGLPNLPALLAGAKSYAERLFQFSRIDRLPLDDAWAALIRPATAAGVQWAREAAHVVLEASAGYPYFLQQYGQTSWDAAAASPITVDDAREGIRLGRERLDSGFFRARWERATPAERDYLAAMAVDGDGPSSTGELAERLDKKASSLGPARANLMAKGLVYAPQHGLIAFTVPGMADFVQRESALR